MGQQLSFLEQMEKPRLDALFKPDQIFESNDGNFIARLTEDTRFDRKSGRVDGNGLATCLSAFGNGPAVEGGVIAVGIEKDGSITGCKVLSEAKLNEIETAGRDHCPDGRFEPRRVPVTNRSGEDDFLILIRVYYVESRLVSLRNDQAFCRQGDQARRLTDAEKQEIRISKGERSFELEPSPLSYPDDFRTQDIANLVSRVRRTREASDEVSNLQIMQSLRLGRVTNSVFTPNNVCVLLFATIPSSHSLEPTSTFFGITEQKQRQARSIM